ncbi:MAG: sulfotransferase family 2 domain-containing protein [Myxococcales bacterium]|nr:sulfotransferase family 2 domain-containing protein [Myxococcales bacterium]
MDQWFEMELKVGFDIDIPSKKFDRTRKLNFYKGLGVDLVVLRMKFLRDSMKPVLKEALLSAQLVASAAGGLPPVVIFQVGKVGSTTVKRSLMESGIANPVYHVHFLSRQGLSRARSAYLEAGMCVDGHVHQGERLRRLQSFGFARMSRWKLITLVRDPVSRTISSFFQNFRRLYPCQAPTTNEILARLHGIFEDEAYGQKEMDQWFEMELKPGFDIDILSKKFDRTRKFNFYEGPGADLVVLRMEDLRDSLTPAINTLLGRNVDVRLVEANKAEDKSYATQYSDVKSKLRFPEETLKKLYGSPLIEHFYSEEKLELMKKWSTKAKL